MNGAEATYGYDVAGRLHTISNGAGVFAYTWHSDANWVQSIVYPNGVVVSNLYNKMGWLAERRNLKPDATVVSSFAYSYDALGMRTDVLFADGSGCAYGYDSSRQLASAQGYLTGGSQNPTVQFAYTYDGLGNRTNTSHSGVVTAYGVNELNQYSYSIATDGRSGTNAFAYDANGNLTLELSPTRYACYGWNEENRLASFTNGAHRSEFFYNGLGFLVELREYENGILQQTTRHVYDGLLPVVDVDAQNTPLRSYLRGLDLAVSFDRAGGIGGLLMLWDHESGVAANYCFDGNGNVVNLLTSGNEVAANYEYEPFGTVVVSTGFEARQPKQWSSKDFHGLSQLSYYGFRHYKGDTGKWLSRDPLEENDVAKPLHICEQQSN